MTIGALLFFIELEKGYYFIAFIAGLRLSDWYHPIHYWKKENSVGRQIADILFIIQKYCYSFFLIHGAILLLFVEKTTVSEFSLFWLSFLISAMLSVVLYAVTIPVQTIVVKKTLNLFEKTLVRSQ